MFEIILSEKAVKDFKKLDTNTGLQIARKLSDSKIGTFRFRIGDYRAIVDIEENKIIVLKVGHRKDIYK